MALPAASPGTPAPAEDWVGIAAAAEAPVLAVWSERRVFVRRGERGVFREAGKGPGQVLAVALSEAGDLFVAREGRRLIVERRDGTRFSARLPGPATSHLLAAGGRLVWLGHRPHPPDSGNGETTPLLGVSSDDGKRFNVRVVTRYPEFYFRQARLSPDGRLALAVEEGDCRSRYYTMRGHADGGGWRDGPDGNVVPLDKYGAPLIRDWRGRQVALEDLRLPLPGQLR